MYTAHFGLSENPFSISPDPRYLYMSQRHREALAHLLYGTQQAGGFIQLTGEVGTGKTTLTRALLQQLPKNVDVALLLNPKQSAIEFLQSICDELRIPYNDARISSKIFVDALNHYLLEAHQKNRHTVLLIDEAQNLTVDVLEQIRLLTNLETTKKKLLQIILVGQPELRVLLSRKDLRQLAQRITARYHLLPLSENETIEFIQHRLTVAGQSRLIFNKGALRQIQYLSKGIPRLINILCDRALLGAYSQGKTFIDAKIVRRAAEEVTGKSSEKSKQTIPVWYKPAIAASLLLFTGTIYYITQGLPGTATITENVATAAALLDKSTTSNLLETMPLPSRIADPDTIEDENIDKSEAEHFFTQTGNIVNDGTALKVAITLDSLLKDNNLETNTGSAYAELFTLWSKDYYSVKGVSACEKASKLGLSCWHNKGTWNNLRLINRPAVIELTDSDNNHHNVVVTSMRGRELDISFGGKIFTLPVADVDAYWYGNFVVLWRQPPVNLETIRPGVTGNAALWLKQTLNKVDGMPVAEDLSNIFDGDLEKRVKAFQKERYLNDDGVVGKQTMIHLNTALNDPTIPLLTNNLTISKKNIVNFPQQIIQ